MSFVAFRPFGDSGVGVFDTPTPLRHKFPQVRVTVRG